MRKSVFFFVAVMMAAVGAIGAAGGPARASTSDVCRFQSNGGMVYDGVTGYSLEFWWRRDTNAILHQKFRTTRWTDSAGVLVGSAYTADPGSVTGSDGITSPSAVMAQFAIKLNSGVPGYPIIIWGNLANGGFHTATPYVFSGIYSGTSQVWFSGNGVVTCGYSILVP